MTTVKLTMAQALVRYLVAQHVEVDGREAPLFAGVWAIFGHGNVAGIGEALAAASPLLPTWRGHNEQAMAHAATAYAKAMRRRQVVAITTSVGPGATNLVTAAATAHVNRLPLLLLPGDTFQSRIPDPVLQQLEDFAEPARTVNDCLRPVSRYFDRIVRPEQLLRALPQAVWVLTDPAACGPVTLALPQDVQAEAYDYPVEFFGRRVHHIRKPRADRAELTAAADALRAAKAPLIIAGGGVHYAEAAASLGSFALAHGFPVAETQAGKGAVAWDHPCQVGGIGVTGSAAANQLAREADVVLAVGTRLTDFTTASRTLFENPELTVVGLNVGGFDAAKHGALPLVCDAGEGLGALAELLADVRAPEAWTARAKKLWREWNHVVDLVTRPAHAPHVSDAQVLGAVNRQAQPSDIVVCAAGGLPGELHKLWRVPAEGGYHLEYGYSCMGYEIAGGLGVKLAHPRREVFVLVGDGSYLMLNSEIATSVAMGVKLNVVVLDNHGFGCIERLQKAVGCGSFNNLRDDKGGIDFAGHARALGAESVQVITLDELAAALAESRKATRTWVTVIQTDPALATSEGGAWWDVPVAAVSEREEVGLARRAYEASRGRQRRMGP